ncbi:MAG: HIT domain-containing protein [Phycisphaeraceae bacterium]|nr:HIT domain-containing protein [Phycisphaeraceae bacterium]
MDAHDPTPEALQAPWRQSYLESMDDGAVGSEGRAVRPQADGASETGSFLLRYWQEPAGDERNHVIVRTASGLVLLNAFPYAAGHLLVALGEPRPTLLDYSAEQRRRLWELVDVGMGLMIKALRPQGVNIGLNQGRAAGAGVPQHLHAHLVPRWGGDVNFMSVVGQIRVIPASLEKMAERYREAWRAMGGQEAWRAAHGVEL